MLILTIQGLRPSFTDDVIIRGEISQAVASIQELHLERTDTTIVYSAGGPPAGKHFMDDDVYIEIILWEKPERTKKVLDTLCTNVRDVLMNIYPKSDGIKFRVLAIPYKETCVGESLGMWTETDAE
jgi:hypothetical protein